MLLVKLVVGQCRFFLREETTCTVYTANVMFKFLYELALSGHERANRFGWKDGLTIVTHALCLFRVKIQCCSDDFSIGYQILFVPAF